jgi:choice-of-anchor A domain-containing protein
MNHKHSWSALVIGAGLAGAAQAQSQLSTYNLIVRHTLYQANHVYGRVIAQNIDTRSSSGNTGQNIEIGSRLGGPNSEGITPISSQSTPSLLVGDRIRTDSGGVIRLMNGSAFLDQNSSDAPSTPIQLQQSSNGATIQRPSNPGSAQSSTFDSVYNAVLTEASTYSNYSANATTSTSGTRTTFTIPASTSVRQVVFNLTESQASSIFETQNAEVQFDLNGRQVSSLDFIIVNIAGFRSNDFNSQANFLGSITSDVNLRSRVLWNFYDTDEVVELNRNWYGSILAPEATLEGNSNLDGSAAVKYSLFNAEIHGPAWVGVPEPSTYAAISFVVAVGGMTVWRRRRALKA